MEPEIQFPPRQLVKVRKKSSLLLISFLIFLMLTNAFLVYLLFFEYEPIEEIEPILPSMVQEHPYPIPLAIEDVGHLFPTINNGELMDFYILMREGHFFIPFHFIQEEIDPAVFLEEETELLIFSSHDKVVTLKNTYLTNELSQEIVELQFPMLQVNETFYVPYAPFKDIYPYHFILHPEAEVVEVLRAQIPQLTGTIIEPLIEIIEEEEGVDGFELEPPLDPLFYLRRETTDQSPYMDVLEPYDQVRILSEQDGWYRVQSERGFIGFLPKEDILLTGVWLQEWEQIPRSYAPWNPIGKKINLTWEHVVRVSPNPANITPPSGVNVISPTWFHLLDSEGTIQNLADARYVEWAHRQGYQVWALVTNGFNPDRTHEVLSQYEKRKKVINQLVHYAQIYNLDGINIDFENVYPKDKQNFVQFMRELTPYLHEQGLVVSVDITITGGSERYSLFLDRKALSEIVDYLILMTYDEHWGTSPVAGSVASLPWVERGVIGVLREVPNEKLLLGVPFYTRLWKEEVVDGRTRVSSRAYSMEGIEKWLSERNLEPVLDEASGQYYTEYLDVVENVTYKVWIENEHSMVQRVALVHKYDLAGIASWRRGFEKPVIWDVIQNGLEQRLHTFEPVEPQ